MKNFWYLFAAYAAIWALIGGYLLGLGSRIARLEKKDENRTDHRP
jgi:CcmD family protein